MSRLIGLFRNWKLRYKLIATYAILIIIPLVTLGLYAYRTAEGYLNQQARIGLANTTQQMALTIDEKIAQPINFMNFMIFNPTVKKVTGFEWGDDYFSYTKELNDNIEPTIWYYININPEISDIVFYSEFTPRQIGNFVYPSGGVSNASWYRKARNNNHTNWYYENGSLFAARKILKSDNSTPAGVVYLKLRHDEIFEKLRAGRLPGEGMLILDENNRPIYSNLVGGQIREEDITSIRGIQEGQIRLAGREYLISRSSLRNAAWTLYDITAVNGLLVDTRGIIHATASIVLACLLVLGLFIWLFSRTIVMPMYTLKRKINIVENGDFGIPITSSSRDEIGELTESFGRMVERVKQSWEERDRARVLEKEAELKALQAQINPHFLYNVLSTINWRAIQIEAPDISRITNLLSQFYRTSLNKGLRITSVQGEITNVKAYLDIQQMMHRNSFDVVIDVEERVKPLAMLNFILQPIVENAILHGIDEKEEGRGIVRILSRMSDAGTLVFIVEDNGKGMAAEQVERLYVSEGGGYGFRNVHERIRLHYGEWYGVKLESMPNIGTKVVIEMPVGDIE